MKKPQVKPTREKRAGVLFQFFNIGFTVLMFVTPTILLGYWYLYLRPTPAAPNQTRVATPLVDSGTERGPQPDPAMNGDEPSPAGEVGTPDSPGRFRAPFADDAVEKPMGDAAPTYPVRTWSDPSGEYKIQARLKSVTGDQATLITPEQREMKVLITKLSEADLEYLRGVFRSKGLSPSF